MKTQIHNFKVGDRVTVYNRTLGGRFVIEGKASIRKVLTFGEDMYSVVFLDEKRGHYDRFVDPNGQDNPEEYVKQLNSAYREPVEDLYREVER